MHTTCQFTIDVSDSIHYGEAAEKEEWRTLMLEEMKSIEKKRMTHGIWWNYQRTKMQLV